MSRPAASGDHFKLIPRKKEQTRFREIQVLLVSAQDLKDVKHIAKMRTYAVVYVHRDYQATTHVDVQGGANPTWNEKLTVRFPETTSDDVMAALNVDIYAHGHVREKPVGSARVLLCDALKGGEAAEPANNPIQCLALQVWRPSGRPQGVLNIWVPPTGRFLETSASFPFSSAEVKAVEEEAVDFAGGCLSKDE